MGCLRRCRAWTLVPRKKARNILSTKWVFRRKNAIDGKGKKFLRYKARLVRQGLEHIFGLDFFETFPPVVAVVQKAALLDVPVVKAQPYLFSA